MTPQALPHDRRRLASLFRPAAPAAASLPGTPSVAQPAAQAARFGHRPTPMVLATGTALPQETP